MNNLSTNQMKNGDLKNKVFSFNYQKSKLSSAESLNLWSKHGISTINMDEDLEPTFFLNTLGAVTIKNQ